MKTVIRDTLRGLAVIGGIALLMAAVVAAVVGLVAISPVLGVVGVFVPFILFWAYLIGEGWND